MLQSIRDRSKGIFAWVIVGLISVPFALWGVNSYFDYGTAKAVAVVDGVEIGQGEVQQAYLNQRDRLQAMLGESFRPELIDEQRMKQQVLQQLIDRSVLEKSLIESGYRVSNQQVAREIGGIEAFHMDGRFDQEIYAQRLRSQGMTPTGFEARIRQSMVPAQFYEALSSSAFITEHQAVQSSQLNRQQREIELLKILPKDPKQVDIEAAQIESHYQQNQSLYQRPEQVQAAYIELSASNLASQVKVTEQQLRARYEERKQDFGAEAERRASHILISSDTRSDDEALALANSIYQQIQNGESFEALAKSKSDDGGSAEAGGDLGFFAKGMMVPEFEAKAFAMSKGEISGPVKSEFGYHIIQVTDVRAEDVKPFEAVREELHRELAREAAELLLDEKLEMVANLAYENADTLEIAAQEAGVELKKSDWITRTGGTDIGQSAAVRETLFSPEVLTDGLNSEPLELDDGRTLFVRVLEHRPAELRPLAEVRDEIETQLQRQAATKEAEEKAAVLFKRARDGEALRTLASEAGLKTETLTLSRTSNTEADPSIIQAAFSLPKEATQAEKKIDRVSLREGGAAILQLKRVITAEAEQGETLESMRESLSGITANAELDGLISGMKQRVDIVVNPEEL